MLRKIVLLFLSLLAFSKAYPMYQSFSTTGCAGAPIFTGVSGVCYYSKTGNVSTLTSFTDCGKPSGKVLIKYYDGATTCDGNVTRTSTLLLSWNESKCHAVTNTTSAKYICKAPAAATDPAKVVKQNLEFTGLTKAQVDGKKTEIEAGIARALEVAAADVTITSVTESESRRRKLLAKKVVISYEVKVKDESTATALVSKMKKSDFADATKSEVATALNIAEDSITISAKEPEVENAAKKETKSDLSSTIVNSPNVIATALVLSTIFHNLRF